MIVKLVQATNVSDESKVPTLFKSVYQASLYLGISTTSIFRLLKTGRTDAKALSKRLGMYYTFKYVFKHTDDDGNFIRLSDEQPINYVDEPRKSTEKIHYLYCPN